MNKRSSGFTLVEIAIVLVIVGLLIGGVLAGQQLIRSARVRNLIAQQDGAKAAFFGFQDRYRALPGDYKQALTNINCPPLGCLNGDGNGRIEAPNSVNLHEEILAWTHLSAAGFLNGSYSMLGVDTTPAPGNTPRNPYGGYMQVATDGLWGTSNHVGPPAVSKLSVKTGNQIPVEIVAEIDRKIDDGLPYGGAFQFSTYSGSGNPPDVGGTNDDSCTNNDSDAGGWNETNGQSNCGAASLL